MQEDLCLYFSSMCLPISTTLCWLQLRLADQFNETWSTNNSRSLSFFGQRFRIQTCQHRLAITKLLKLKNNICQATFSAKIDVVAYVANIIVKSIVFQYFSVKEAVSIWIERIVYWALFGCRLDKYSATTAFEFEAIEKLPDFLLLQTLMLLPVNHYILFCFCFQDATIQSYNSQVKVWAL